MATQRADGLRVDITERNFIADELAAVKALVANARLWPHMADVAPAELDFHLIRLSEAVAFIEAIIFKCASEDDRDTSA